MELDTMGLGAGSYPEPPEEIETIDEEEKEYLEYEEYEDRLLEEKIMEENNGKEN